MGLPADARAHFDHLGLPADQAETYWPGVRTGLGKAALRPQDVVALVPDMGLWVICTRGLFRVLTRPGLLGPKAYAEPFRLHAEITAVHVESSGPTSKRIVLTADGNRTVGRIEFADPARCAEVDALLRAARARSR